MLNIGHQTKSGVPITPDSAMRVIAVYACVRVLSETLASVPLHIYRRLPNGDKERAYNHPLEKIFSGNQPNDWQTSYEFKETLQGSTSLQGNGYGLISRSVNGQVLEILPIQPHRVEPLQDKNFDVKYKIQLDDGDFRIFKKEDVFHLRGIGHGLVGLNPISLARESLGVAQAAEETAGTFFGNGVRTSGILTTPEKLPKEKMEQMRETVADGFSRGNSFNAMVLDGGWDWKQLSLKSSDAQFLETRKFQITEIARLFRVPPHMISDLERATFSNIEHQGLEFVKYTVLPWVSRWEGKINKTLISPQEQGEYFAEFNLEGLLRADTAARGEFYNKLFNMGVMNANEIRKRENMNPRKDAGGDEYMRPLNMEGSNDKEVSDEGR